MNDSSTALKKYIIRTVLFMGSYTAVNVAAIFGAFDDLRSPGTWVFALVVAAPLIGHIWAALAFMRDSDEFMRNLMAKRSIVALGIVMAVASAWGFMEVYAHVPHVPCMMIVPLFWGVYGGVSYFIQTTL